MLKGSALLSTAQGRPPLRLRSGAGAGTVAGCTREATEERGRRRASGHPTSSLSRGAGRLFSVLCSKYRDVYDPALNTEVRK